MMKKCKPEFCHTLSKLNFPIAHRICFVLSLASVPLLSYGETFDDVTETNSKLAQTTPSSNKSANTQKSTSVSSGCRGWQNPQSTPWTIEVRGAAFLPFEHQLKDIYGTALPSLQVESSYRVTGNLAQKGDQLLVWGNAGWTTKEGKSIGFGYYSQLDLIPFSAGIEYEVNCFAGLDFYCGVGATYSLLRVKNYDGFRTTHLNREAWGFTTKTGFRYTFCKHFIINVFGDYYHTRFEKMNHDSIQPINNNFDAFFVGGSIGVRF